MIVEKISIKLQKKYSNYLDLLTAEAEGLLAILNNGPLIKCIDT